MGRQDFFNRHLNRYSLLCLLVNVGVALFVTFSVVHRLEENSPAATFAVEMGSSVNSDGGLEREVASLTGASLFGELAALPAENASGTESLGLELRGVIAGKGLGFAFIARTGKPDELYAVGQEPLPGVVLLRVYVDHIVLRRGHQVEQLALQGADVIAGGALTITASIDAGTSAKPFTISRESVRTYAQTPQEFLSHVVLVPEAGRGFLLKEVEPGSPIEQWGLRAGDVIHHANGMNVNRVDDIRRVYQQLAQADRLKLELYRNGKQEELNYRIVR